MLKVINHFSRLKIILSNSSVKNWPAILILALNPKTREKGEHFRIFLEKKGIIKYFPNEKKISFLDFIFFHNSPNLAALASDIVSIWGKDFPSFSEKLLKSKAYSFEGPYENDEVFIKEGDFVVDAGANIGLFSLLASQKVGSSGKIYAFEPIKDTREILKKNISVNRLNNISVLPFALGEKSGEVDFSLLPDPGSNALSSLIEESQERRHEKVEVKTLDEIIAQGTINHVDFIKSDIEGMERDLIIGARNSIKRFHPRLSICIYHRPDDREVLSRLIHEIEPKYKISFSYKKMFAIYEDSY